MNVKYPSTVAVLGSGIQGISTALALYHAGWNVELIDRTQSPMMRTSLTGEGKLHLGYVYGNDRSLETASLMVEGALQFSGLLDGWVHRPVDWGALRSEPFTYAILSDTLVSSDRLGEHYHQVDDLIEASFNQGVTYAGLSTFSRTKKLVSTQAAGFTGDVIAAYLTSEVSVDPLLLRDHLIASLEAFQIPFRPNSTVKHVRRVSAGGFSVELEKPDGSFISIQTDAVVNCLWDGRIQIDATMGIVSPRPCIYRMKYAVHGTIRTRPDVPLTTTFALGPYGDVVCRNNGRVYLSWYPDCLGGIIIGNQTPESWELELQTSEITAHRQEIVTRTLIALGDRLEFLRDVQVDAITAGVIVAWGESDIDKPNSKLHQRNEIGVTHYDGYVSVDTGKFTTAPLFASRVVEALDNHLKRRH